MLKLKAQSEKTWGVMCDIKAERTSIFMYRC